MIKFLSTALIFITTLGHLQSAIAAWAIEKSTGEITLTRGGKAVSMSAGTTPLKSGDVLTTAATGKAYLKDGDSEIWVGSGTQFKVNRLIKPEASSDGRFDVLKGKVRVHFKRPSGPEDFPYTVRAKSVVAGVRGTEFFVSVEEGEEKVCTFDGMVRVTMIRSDAQSWDVPAGKGLVVRPKEMPKVRETTAEQSESWKKLTTL